MPSPAVILTDPILDVRPGESVETRLIFRNTSSIVGQFRVSMAPTCEAHMWSSFRSELPSPGPEQPQVDVSFLRKSNTAEVVVTFRPPAARSTPSGHTPYLIRVEALDNDNESTTAEGVLHIEPLPDIKTKFVSDKPRSRTRGRFALAVANAGNTPVQVKLTSDYPHHELSVDWVPEQLTLQPREVDEFLIELKPRLVRTMGPPANYAADFKVAAATSNGEIPVSQNHVASLEQPAWIPRAALPLAGLLVAAGALGIYASRPPPQDPNAPDPPVEIRAVQADTAGSELQVSWTPDRRSVTTRVGIFDCDNAPSDSNPLAVADFDDVTTGRVPIPDTPENSVCVTALSIGSDGKESIWAPEPFEFSRPNLSPPTNLRIEGEDLVFQQQADPSLLYQVYVDGGAVTPPLQTTRIPLTDLSLGNKKSSISVLTVLGEGVDAQFSALSEPLEYQPNERFLSPWILLFYSSSEISDERFDGVSTIVGRLGGKYGGRAGALDVQEIPPQHPSTELPFFVMLSNGQHEVSGDQAIVHFPNDLDSSGVVDFCNTLLEGYRAATQTPQDGFDPSLVAFQCFAFDGDGNQLVHRTTTTG